MFNQSSCRFSGSIINELHASGFVRDKILGDNNKIRANKRTVCGSRNVIIGDDNTIEGDFNKVIGKRNQVKGKDNIVIENFQGEIPSFDVQISDFNGNNMKRNIQATRARIDSFVSEAINQEKRKESPLAPTSKEALKRKEEVGGEEEEKDTVKKQKKDKT